MGFLGFSGLGEPPKQIVSGFVFFTSSVSRLDRPSEVWGLGSRRNKFVSMTFVFVFLHRRSFTFSSVRPPDRLSRSKSFVHSSVCSIARLRNKFAPEIFVSVSLRRVRASAGPSIRPFLPFDGRACLRA